MESIQTRVIKAWHSRYSWVYLLWPICLVFLYCFFGDGSLFIFIRVEIFPAPVIVVGNISVGGCGKTPLLIALANQLIDRGLNIAIVSRGYGAVDHYPVQVNLDTLASKCGDEPLLIRQSLPLKKLYCCS